MRNKEELSAMKKANAVISFLKGNEVKEPFILNNLFPVVDFGLFVKSHESALNNLRPLSPYWRAWYMRAYEAKKHIENQLKKEE